MLGREESRNLKTATLWFRSSTDDGPGLFVPGTKHIRVCRLDRQDEAEKDLRDRVRVICPMPNACNLHINETAVSYQNQELLLIVTNYKSLQEFL